MHWYRGGVFLYAFWSVLAASGLFFLKEKIKVMHAAYHAAVEEFDREIGKVLSALEKAGIRDETLIIYSSDHGEAARAHGNVGKMSMYEDSIRIPLIISSSLSISGTGRPCIT